MGNCMTKTQRGIALSKGLTTEEKKAAEDEIIKRVLRAKTADPLRRMTAKTRSSTADSTGSESRHRRSTFATMIGLGYASV